MWVFSKPLHVVILFGLPLALGEWSWAGHHPHSAVKEVETQQDHILPGWVQLVQRAAVTLALWTGALQGLVSTTQGSGSHFLGCAQVTGSSSAVFKAGLEVLP